MLWELFAIKAVFDLVIKPLKLSEKRILFTVFTFM